MKKSHTMTIVRMRIALILMILSLGSCIYDDLKHDLTILAQGNGTVSPEGKIQVTENEPQTITALPDPDYNFIGWEIVYGTGVSFGNVLDAETTVTLSESDAVIRAFFADTEGPVGSFTINEGNENTITTTVTLTNSIIGAMEMRFGNTPEEVQDAPWESYRATKEWTLFPWAAIKTVLGQFRDLAGNIYETEDTIRLIKKIIPGDGAAEDFFGICVTISADGSTIAVGAYYDDDNGTDSGSVFIYNGTHWGTETKITPSDGAAEDHFGISVALSADGSTIAVGAPYDDDNGTDSGSVYIFDGTHWGAETKITTSDGAAWDSFGNSVALSADGSTIAVGATYDDDNGSTSGSVYIFDGTYWDVETKITPSDGAAGDWFGHSVAISADSSTIVVGAYYDDDNDTDSGSVYIFDGTHWGAETKITPSDGAAEDYFGKSVAIFADGSTIVVGAYGDDDNGSNSGSVYTFDGTYWGTETKITPGDGAAADYFGKTVALSADGSTIAVGAHYDDDNGSCSGSVYIFDGIHWGTETKITPGDGAAGDYFGNSVAISADGSTIAVGAYWDDDNGTDSGSAYVIPLE